MVKKEAPRKGPMFWKYAQSECNFFEWEPREEATCCIRSKRTEGEIGKRAQRRSKSPKRTEEDTPAKEKGKTIFHRRECSGEEGSL